MGELETRPMSAVQVPALLTFLKAVEAVDAMGEHYSADDLAEELANPTIDPARDWMLVLDGDEVIAHWRLFPRGANGPDHKVILDGAVRPDRRGQGLGSELVPAMLARAAAYVEERTPGLQLEAVATGRSDDDAQADLFATHGLLPDRWTFQMGADLHAGGATAVELADGYTLETWTPETDEELRAAHNTAFLDHPGFTPWDEQLWHQWVSQSRSFRPALTFYARDTDGAMAAYVQGAVYDATFDATGLHEGYVSKVGTLREHRGHGLASSLLRHSLNAYRDAGLDRAALHVDSANPTGALGVYERAGFTVEKRLTDYRLSSSYAGGAESVE